MVTRILLCAAVVLCGPSAWAEDNDKLAKTDAPPAAQSDTTPPTAEAEKPEADGAKTEEAKDEIKLLEIEKNIIRLTNAERARHGLAPLEIDVQLMRSAREHAIWMTRFRRLQHTHKPLAENIAMGYTNSQAVVRGWMNSSGHRANILNRSHRRIGVAAYVTDGGTIYWCQQFRR